VRRVGAALVAVSLAFALAACGDDDGGEGSSDGAAFGECEIASEAGELGDIELVEDGVLTVATNLPAPGFWNGDDPDSVNGGFEYCMAAEIATSLGLDAVEVVNVSFDALVAGQTGGFDLALSQVTITTERAEVVDFSVPYFSADQGVMVNAGTAVSTIEEAKALNWGVQTATTGQIYLDEVIQPESEPASFQDTPSMFAALTSGQVDAVMMDTSIVLGQAAESDGEQEVVAQFSTGEEYGAIYEKGSPSAAGFDAVITSLYDAVTLEALTEKWLAPIFGGDPNDIPYITP
jgi:polar amino acid transport system substrate-binding protein